MSTLDDKIAADTAALETARAVPEPVSTPALKEDMPAAILEAVDHSDYDAPPDQAETAPEPSPDTPEPDVKPEPDHDGERFKRLRLEAKEAKRRARELEARLAEVTAGNPAALDEATVMQRAEQIAQAKVFNVECEKIAAEGNKAFKDFNETMADLWDTLNVPPGQVHVPLVEAAIEAGDPHKILHFLGSNPDEAERIAMMPLHRQGAAIAKLATKLSTPAVKPVSKAPPPIQPVTGGSAAPVERDPLKMSFAEFEKQHQKQRHDRIWGS